MRITTPNRIAQYFMAIENWLTAFSFQRNGKNAGNPIRIWWKKTSRKFLVGSTEIKSSADYKTALARGRIALISFFVGLAFIISDSVYGIYGHYWLYSILCAASLSTILLNQRQMYLSANAVFLTTVNIIVFLFADNDHGRNGVHTFFICNAVVSFTLFNFKLIRYAVFFSILPLVLFIIAYSIDLRLVEPVPMNEGLMHNYFITTFTISFTACLLIVYFHLRTSHSTEIKLIKSIDKRRHADKRLRAKNKLLMKANKELDLFSYSVSHDLRSPLCTIMGLVNIYKLTPNPEEKTAVVDLINNHAVALDTLIRNILHYSNNSKLGTTMQMVDLKSSIESVLEELRAMNRFDDVKVEIDIQPNTLVKTDQQRFKIILSNLISNSIKYSDPSKDSFISIHYSQHNGNHELSVRDNGIGISKDHSKNIFNMFYRAHDESKGAGLGLYIVRETVQRMGGKVSVDSKPGKGSTFSFVLPSSEEHMFTLPMEHSNWEQ